MSILLYTILFSQEKVEFTSASPFGLKDIITSLYRQKIQQVIFKPAQERRVHRTITI